MQRVAIARALVNDPEILLADEPTGNLDSVNSSHVMDILQNLAEKLSKTLLVASHSTELARRADRTLVMKDGKLLDA
jgi:ABC-type lipoprotein export system ATPase subunit